MGSRQGRKLNRGRMVRAAVPALIAAGVCGVIALVWDFYYDLNDDTMMAAILSGAYTGTPALRNIQSYFPLTALLGELQRLIPFVPWYGVFLAAMPFVCLYLILRRIGTITAAPDGSGGRTCTGSGLPVPGETGEKTLRQNRTMTWTKRTAACGAVAVLLFTGMLLYHLVFLQYSVVVGIMGATAAFLFLTMAPKGSAGAWAKEILPQLILIWLGYLLRSEMMLFVSPFIALSFLIRLLDMDLPRHRRAAQGPEEAEAGDFWKTDCPHGNRLPESKRGERPGRAFTKPLAALFTLALVLAGLAAGYLGNYAGYASQDWQEFYAFFDARTDLYDFQSLPEYEGNEEFYGSIGLDEAEAALILNYNFGLDEDIDAGVIAQIAEYAAQKAAEEQLMGQRLKNALWDYRQVFSSGTEQPYNTIALLLYVLALAAVLQRGIAGRTARRSARGVGFGRSRAAADTRPVQTEDSHGRESGRRPARYLLLRTGELLILFAGRSALLLYLYYNNRPVVRLTHSIYLAEAVILVWVIFESLPGKTDRNRGGTDTDEVGSSECRSAPDVSGRNGRKDKAERLSAECRSAEAAAGRGTGIRIGRSGDGVIRAAFTALTVVIFSCALIMQVRDVREEYAAREEVNADWTAFMEYCESNPENVYFTDVYSTVSFSEKIFDGEEEAVNYVLMGGWVSKSPLEAQKFAYLGLDGETSLKESEDASGSGAEDSSRSGSVMEISLLYQENCYFASRSTYDVSWIVEYYSCKGMEVEVTAVDTIGDFWTIYTVAEIP